MVNVRSRLTLAVTVLAGSMAVSLAWSAGEKEAHEVPRQAPSKRPAPIVDIHELMEIFNEPLYERMQEAMQKEPGGNKEWNRLKDAGFEAAEIINLVAIREMGDEHRAVWPELNRTAQQASLDFAHAAAAKDWAKTQKAYRALIENCNDCHQKVAPDHAPTLEP